MVAHVERRKAALGGVVAVLLHDDRRRAADRTRIVERFRKRVEPWNETPCVKRWTTRTCNAL